MARQLSLIKSPSSILSEYRLNKKLLRKGENEKGLPAIQDGVDRDGNYVIIKTWKRNVKVEDSGLREIWKNELRQLHRLEGYPGANQYITELKETAEDAAGFYLIIAPGVKSFLHSHLDSNKKSVPTDSERDTLWKNLKRVINGLQILHSQGMLHRKVDEWAVLTEHPLESVDFELTGFEWSMRLSSSNNKFTNAGKPYSFIDDWKGLGHLTCRILNISVARMSDTKIPSSDVSGTLSTDETILIRQLMQTIPTPELSYEDIINRITEIETNLITRSRQSDKKLKIGFSIGERGRLSNMLRKLSENRIETSNTQEQIAFLINDLAKPSLVATDDGKKFLVGDQLTYEIQDYVSPGDRSKSNWAIAFCEKAENQQPILNANAVIMQLGNSALEILTAGEANAAYGRPTSRINTWLPLIRNKVPKLRTQAPPVSQEFWLVQITEYIFALLDHFPITIISSETSDSGLVTITVKAREDERIETIRRLLNVKENVDTRLLNTLREDTIRINSHWIITDKISIGSNLKDLPHWTYYAMDSENTGYRLSSDALLPDSSESFLVSTEHKGTHAQFKRKAKALRALGEHSELLRMLTDPREKIKNSHDECSVDAFFSDLDTSKQEALKNLLGTLPLFLIQGPPGVGKTRLIKELLRRKYAEDASNRFLLTAQSNSAIDHLLDEAKDVFNSNAKPLIVRSGQKNNINSDFNFNAQCKELVDSVKDSVAYQTASHNIKEKIDLLANTYTVHDLDDESEDSVKPKNSASRALEGLLLRSANFVFSTTNSSEIERLIEERGQFDWTIIEEAGKATGVELLSPLLLSHRRLLIGDHKQLPPFGADKISKALINSTSLKDALVTARPLISSELLDSSVNDLFSKTIENPDSNETIEISSFSELGRSSVSKLFLFESLIEDELQLQDTNKKMRIIASPLAIQHRMHPAIAELVSLCFYDGNLQTSPEKIMASRTAKEIIKVTNTYVNTAIPIHWINMPWIQTTIGKKRGETNPRYVNDEEIEAIEKLLFELRCVEPNDRPTLAILSPYSQQVKKIRNNIRSKPKILEHLKVNFSVDNDSLSCNTVDSFQGNEADIIIVSLVRNNHHTSIRSTLGFLTDSRRTNVLLSRAKSHLFLIGSINFFESAFAQARTETDKLAIAPLEKLITIVKSTSHAEIIDYTEMEIFTP